MLLSAIAVAHNPFSYSLSLHSVTRLHLFQSTLLPLALIPPSPCQPKWIPSRHPFPVLRIHSFFRPVAVPVSSDAEDLVPSSAAAVAAAIRQASPSSPVKFTQRVQKQGNDGLVLPSPDFRRLCLEQLDLFRMVVDSDAILSVYVRPAGSYVMDQLELCRVAMYPETDISEATDCVILVGNFSIPASLHVAEAALLKQKVEVISESGALVLPMVKHPFVVGFLVAELPKMDLASCKSIVNDEQHVRLPPDDVSLGVAPYSSKKPWEIQAFRENIMKDYGQFTTEQRSRAIMISRSLATAYVMDQKVMLLQQSSWQNNVRMNHLVEQIRGPLSSIRALTKMLSVHVKRSEISYDIIEDLLMQGDYMKDALQQLQDSVYLTKVNMVRYNKEALKKLNEAKSILPELLSSVLPENGANESKLYNTEKKESLLSLSSGKKDLEMPMPPLWLAPLLRQTSIRPCNISDILKDLVGAALPLADRQQRSLEFNELQQLLQVAVEESSLRQALSNLIEGALLRTHIGGKVQIYATAAPAGGALVIIDDDGPDMHYMTQMRTLAPFGVDLLSEGMAEDNMTWNFVAGLSIAREILENYGCIVRAISPRIPNAAFGVGGTRIELWFPPLQSDSVGPLEEV